MSSLKDEVLELSVRLTQVTKERDQLEKSLNKMHVSCFRGLWNPL